MKCAVTLPCRDRLPSALDGRELARPRSHLCTRDRCSLWSPEDEMATARSFSKLQRLVTPSRKTAEGSREQSFEMS